MSGKVTKLLPVTSSTDEYGKAGVNFIEVSVYYSKGGMNYFTSRNERRGIYVSASPIEKTANTRSYMGFSGIKAFGKELKRFSQKQLDLYVGTAACESLKRAVVAETLNKNAHLKLTKDGEKWLLQTAE